MAPPPGLRLEAHAIADGALCRLRSLTELKGCCAAETFTWTPDGRRLAYLRDEYYTADGAMRKLSTGLYTIEADGTKSLRLATLPTSAGLGGLSWAP